MLILLKVQINFSKGFYFQGRNKKSIIKAKPFQIITCVFPEIINLCTFRSAAYQLRKYSKRLNKKFMQISLFFLQELYSLLIQLLIVLVLILKNMNLKIFLILKRIYLLKQLLNTKKKKQTLVMIKKKSQSLMQQMRFKIFQIFFQFIQENQIKNKVFSYFLRIILTQINITKKLEILFTNNFMFTKKPMIPKNLNNSLNHLKKIQKLTLKIVSFQEFARENFRKVLI
ncbi:hypothetical protein ABPG72_003955 [Tetrahymena utriculariae]